MLDESGGETTFGSKGVAIGGAGEETVLGSEEGGEGFGSTGAVAGSNFA